MPACKARFCTVGQGNGISTFAIPDPLKNKELCEQWIHNLGNEKLNIESYVYLKHNIVCEKHFDEGCFVEEMQAKMLGYVPKKKKLKPDAVPTIFADSREPPKRKLTCTPKRSAKKEQPKMSDELLNINPEMPSNSDDCKVSKPKPKRKRLLKKSDKTVSKKTQTMENMPCKKRRVVSMPKKRRTSKPSEETIEEEKETTWPDPVVKVEVAEEDFHSFNQEHPFANGSSADSDASFPVVMVSDNSYSLHTSSIASCANNAYNNYALLEIKTEHDIVNESTGMDVSTNFEIRTDHVKESTGMGVSRHFEIKTEYDSVSESTGMGVSRNFEIKTEYDSVSESTGMAVSRSFERNTEHDNGSTGMDVSTNFEIKTENISESTGMDVSSNSEIKTEQDNESTGMDVSTNFEIKTEHDNVNESSSMDVSTNIVIRTEHVNESTGMDVSRNCEIKTEHDKVNESTGMDVSRNFGSIIIYQTVAYQLEIVRYPIKLDHSYSLQDDSKLSGVGTDNDTDFEGFLNSFSDQETAEENENIFHDLALADNVTVEIDGFQELYNDLKAIVKLPFIMLKDEKIRIVELYEKMVKLCVLIDSSYHVEIFVHNRPLPQTHKIFSFVTKERVNVRCIEVLLRHLKEYQVCIGNPQPHCLERVQEGGFVYEGGSPKVIAYREDDFGARKNYFAESYSETVRSVTCDLLLHIFKFKYRCPSCSAVGTELWLRGQREKRKLNNTKIIHSYAKHSGMT